MNNHFEGFSPETCQRLAHRLGFEFPLPTGEEMATANVGQLDFFRKNSSTGQQEILTQRDTK